MDPATRLSPRERQILVNALVDLRDSTAVELPRVAAWANARAIELVLEDRRQHADLDPGEIEFAEWAGIEAMGVTVQPDLGAPDPFAEWD